MKKPFALRCRALPALMFGLVCVSAMASRSAEAQDAAAPKACEPDCRVGYSCVEGECRSNCNPPCGAGLYCTSQRMCALVPVAPAQQAASSPWRALPADPEMLEQREAAALRVQQQLQARQKARVVKEIRLALRETPRLTLGLGLGLAQLTERVELDGLHRNTTLQAGTIAVGWRKNLHRLFGVHGDVNSVIGKAQISDREGQVRDDTFAMSLGVGGGAYFSTGWRLYFGPVASLDYRFYGKDTLTMFGRPYDLNPDGPIHGTLGAEAGLLLGEQEQLDVSARLTAGLPEKLPNFFITARYHLLPRSL
jgi:hypothetical protein